MTVIIKGSDELDLTMFPEEDSEQDIVQNILCILKTTQGSCPNLRDYGLDPGAKHKPVPVAKAAYAVAVSEQFQRYENRATLKNITFEDDPNHADILNPILEVTIP